MMVHRLVEQKDLVGLKEVLDSCGLFPSEFLDEMIADYLSEEEGLEIWLTTEVNGKIVSIVYVGPEKLTNGTYNLYAMGVHEDYQRRGIARSVLEVVEDQLKDRKARLLVIDTSNSDNQLAARALYEKAGYLRESVIQEFWDVGEDKVTYTKRF